MTLYWSIRRELWENRSLYIAPLAVAAVFLAGYLISIVGFPARMHAIAALDAPQRQQALWLPFNMAAGLLMLAGMVVGGFYSIEAMRSERRDRSILFWKSLPVSDTVTVLAKVLVPVALLPLYTFAVTFVLQCAMLVAVSVVLWMNGLSAQPVWTDLSFAHRTALLLYHLVAVHGLWEAPIFGWLLFVSAWARRAAIVWAVLPPFAAGTLEMLVFGTRQTVAVLENRLSGGGAEAHTMPGTFPMDPTTHATIGVFLLSPGLWIGLAVTAVFVAAAIQLRKHRGPAG